MNENLQHNFSQSKLSSFVHKNKIPYAEAFFLCLNFHIIDLKIYKNQNEKSETYLMIDDYFMIFF